MKARMVFFIIMSCMSCIAAAAADSNDKSIKSAKSSKSSKSSKGDEKGEPFQEITALIEANRALIDANLLLIEDNQASIDLLQQQTEQIDGEVAGMQSELHSLAASVISNENDIASLTLRTLELGSSIFSNSAEISALLSQSNDLQGVYQILSGDLTLLQGGYQILSGDLSQLQSGYQSLVADLTQMQIDHAADTSALNADLNYTRNQLVELKLYLQHLVASLNAQLASIQSNAASGSLALDSLLLSLAATTNLALNTVVNIDLLEDMVDELVTRSAIQDAALDSLVSFIALLNSGETPIEFENKTGAECNLETAHLVITETSETDIADNSMIIDFLSSFPILSPDTYLSIWGLNNGNGQEDQHCLEDADRFLTWLSNGNFPAQYIDPLTSYYRVTGSSWESISKLHFWNQGFFLLRAENTAGTKSLLGVYTSNRGGEREVHVGGYSIGTKITFRLANSVQSACGFNPG